MSNLRGSDYSKQIASAFKKTIAFNQGRHGLSTHQTHSNALGLKRQMYLNDYRAFAERRGFSEKLNLTMTNENIKSFLNERLEGLKSSTQVNYTLGFNSLLKGLREKHITVPVSADTFRKIAQTYKSAAVPTAKVSRDISNPDKVIANLYDKRFESGCLAQCQRELSLRISESYKVIENIDKYYNKETGTIENLVGKGNHLYLPKQVSIELVNRIKNCNINALPSQDTYRKDLKEFGVEKSHNWRFHSAKVSFNAKIANDIPYMTALKSVSQNLNHVRASMTLFYLARA